MCTPKEVQEEFVNQMNTAITSWFEDITNDAEQRYEDGIDSDDAYVAKLETIDECAEFMKRCFKKLSGKIELHPLKTKKSWWRIGK